MVWDLVIFTTLRLFLSFIAPEKKNGASKTVNAQADVDQQKPTRRRLKNTTVTAIPPTKADAGHV